jgi:two-component system NtrC family sensor kinase
MAATTKNVLEQSRVVASTPGEPKRMHEKPTARSKATKRILAVDDSRPFLEVVREAFRGDGCEVILAASGEEALDILKDVPVDCVLLDLIMPGIGGYETCRRLKKSRKLSDIPVVLVTAIEDRDSLVKGLSAGADAYVIKSTDLKLLRARILAHVRRKQIADENRLMREQLLRAEMEGVETRAAREIAEARAASVEELEYKNEELESFSYSVAHDLRAPLRSIDGFGLALLEDYGDKLDDTGKEYLKYVRESAQQMAELIDDMLALSRVTRSEFVRGKTDISALAREVVQRLRRSAPERTVDIVVADGLEAQCDGHLLKIVFDNLIGNAWKFTSNRADARIEIGTTGGAPETYFVRDNGAGFDMAYASKLFRPFQRLHPNKEFEGTGIGLAIVQRVIRRHCGKIWTEARVGEGATFYFTVENGVHVDAPLVPPDVEQADSYTAGGAAA